MITLLPIGDPATFESTRDALHTVAEHVLAKARFLDDGEIRLTAFDGGFATPLLQGHRRVRVVAADIAVDDDQVVRRAPLTTVAAAADFVGIDPGFPTQLYAPATELRPDAPLDLDEHSAAALAAWYAFTAAVLRHFAADIPAAEPSELILWPEHFDQAFFTQDDDEPRRANFGASPGDTGVTEPYLYVGPWQAPAANEFWNAPHFDGAVVTLSTLIDSADPTSRALDFLRRGLALLKA